MKCKGQTQNFQFFTTSLNNMDSQIKSEEYINESVLLVLPCTTDLSTIKNNAQTVHDIILTANCDAE